MSADKRPHPSTARGTNATIIVIDDDEGPPRKRQRSITPGTNVGLRNTAKRSAPTILSISSSPEPITQTINNTAAGTEHTPKKPSPWKNRPPWARRSSADVGSSDELDHDEELARWVSKGTAAKKSNEWTNKDTRRMQELSIALGKQDSTRLNHNTNPPRSLTPPTLNSNDNAVHKSDNRLFNGFKLGSADSLRFNPNSSTPLKFSTNSFSSKPDPTTSGQQGLSKPVLQSKQQPQQVVHSVTVPKPPSHRLIQHAQAPARTTANKSHLVQTLSPIPAHPTQNHVPPWPSQPQQVSRLSINVPLTEKARVLRERHTLQERLKQGVEYARLHTEEVGRILGLTAASLEIPVDLDEQKYKNAAQPKKRIVNRKDISLAMGRLCLTDSHLQLSSNDSKELIRPRAQASSILTARFSEHLEPPLTFSNDINDQRLNGKFQFVSEYFLGHGVKASGPIGRAGCTCTGHCATSCQCLKRTFKLEKSKVEWSEQVQQYERLPSGLVVLRDDFIKRNMIQILDDEEKGTSDHKQPQRTEISECNDFCSCDESCVNRVVQKGRTVPLEIFETGRCGFGVRSTANLVRGQFIENYLGEVITDRELDRREDAAEAGSTSYIYSLDWFSSQYPYHVDGQNFGSAMRFVNHSCDPNASTFVVLNNKATKQLHQVAFFALKNIPAGTEITIDYMPQAVGITYELKAADEGMEKCYCGAKNCRQMLWPPGNERKARKRTVGNNFD